MKNRRNAFTIVKILIVIAILGILTCLIIAQFSETDTKVLDAATKADPLYPSIAETDNEIHVNLSSLEQIDGIEKNTKLLRLYIISMENGKEVSEFFEVISDFPTTRKEKIDTAKGYAVAKKYITQEEAENLTPTELDNTTAGVTIVKCYKPTKASL